MTRTLLPALLLANLLALPPALATSGDKVGPETCKACHAVAYDVWRAGPHARTLEALPAQSRKDPRCLSCHAPDAEDGLVGISCEACHGPGRVYSAPYVMRDAELARVVGLTDPGEKVCLACHGESAPSLVRFEYLKKLPLIDHWTRERQAAAAAEPPLPAAKGR
ncbi:MAG TPA: multiheme c-type cytochrome [Anaeromyxobacter sp.]|nr:multiheme c-type cytochrome [Anaeromyxobacter sp.]